MAVKKFTKEESKQMFLERVLPLFPKHEDAIQCGVIAMIVSKLQLDLDGVLEACNELAEEKEMLERAGSFPVSYVTGE